MLILFVLSEQSAILFLLYHSNVTLHQNNYCEEVETLTFMTQFTLLPSYTFKYLAI